MSFLAPIFLAAAAAVALPILFHLIRRTPRGRQVFSSLMFLSPSPPRLTKKKRLENWPLLLLRVLALCLIALAFARPYLRAFDPAAADDVLGRTTVVLVDRSASMQREGLWEQATRQVEAVLDEAGPGDRVAVMGFDRDVEALVSFEQWAGLPVADRAALVMSSLDDVEPTWSHTDVGRALVWAADSLEELAAGVERDEVLGRRQIVLISDMQAGSDVTALRGHDWPTGVTVELRRVTSEQPTNATVRWAADARGDDGEAGEPRVRVNNSDAAMKDQFELEWLVAEGDDGDAAAQPVRTKQYVPAGAYRMVKPPPQLTRSATPGQDPPALDRVRLVGDDHAFDNIAYRAASPPRRATVLYVGGDDPGDPKEALFYLQRALPPTDMLRVQVEPVRGDASFALDGALSPGGADSPVELVVLNEPLPDDRLESLRTFLQDGHTIVVFMNDEAMAATAAKLLGVESLPSSEAEVADYAMLARIDFDHPLFAPLSDARFSDFSKVHFWRYRKFDASGIANARVVAAFEKGDPAVVEAPVGRGRVLLMATGWRPADSQLALSTKFVPLMVTVLERSMGAVERKLAYQVGDAVALAGVTADVVADDEGAETTDDAEGTDELERESNQVIGLEGGEDGVADRSGAVPRPGGRELDGVGDESARVRKPGGQLVNVAAGEMFTGTDRPGIYVVESASPPWSFAVNLASSESDTSPMDDDALEQHGVKLHREDALADAARLEQQKHLLAVELENRHKIWRWLIVAALVVLAIEIWLGGRYARAAGRPSESDTPPPAEGAPA